MKLDIPIHIDELQAWAKAEYDNPELDDFIAKAASTAVEIDAPVDSLEFDVELEDALLLVGDAVEEATPSNANTVVNLFRAAQLVPSLTRNQPVKPQVKVTDAALKLAEAEDLVIDALPSMIEGTGKDGTITKGDVQAFLEDAAL